MDCFLLNIGTGRDSSTVQLKSPSHQRSQMVPRSIHYGGYGYSAFC